MANVISTGADRWKARELRKGENVTREKDRRCLMEMSVLS